MIDILLDLTQMIKEDPSRITSHFDSYYTYHIPGGYHSWIHQSWVRPLNLFTYLGLCVLQIIETISRISLAVLLIAPYYLLKNSSLNEWYEIHCNRANLQYHAYKMLSLPIAGVLRFLFGNFGLYVSLSYQVDSRVFYRQNTLSLIYQN